jgi:hypothetical protein
MAWLWDVPTITSKDTAEGVLLLADLAEASASLSLQTSRQGEILTFLTPEKVRATREQDEARRAKGEADYQTRRAVKLAPDNDEAKKLREEVVEMLKQKE